VVAGAQLVSWSAVISLRQAGCATELMVTPERTPESYAPVAVAGRLLLGVPVATEHRVRRVVGHQRVEGVEVEDMATGTLRIVACDTLVLTGDWVPDYELARRGGLALDPGSRSPLVDAALRTTAPGVFAVGNLVHPVDTADVAVLDGRHVAGRVLDWLARPDTPAPAPADPDTPAVRIICDPPLRWVSPGLWRPDNPPPTRRRYLAWSDQLIPHPLVVVRQDGRRLAARLLPWPASPGRIFRIPAALFAGLNPRGGEARVTLR
jgi:hypothetical protein